MRILSLTSFALAAVIGIGVGLAISGGAEPTPVRLCATPSGGVCFSGTTTTVAPADMLMLALFEAPAH